MGNACQSKHRQALPSSRPYEVEAHVYLVLSDSQVLQVLNCPANLEDSFKDICGTAIQITLSETKHKDHASKRALKNFIPDWFAYKNGETCLVEDIEIEEEKRPFRSVYGPPLASHATFVFAAKSVTQYLDRERRNSGVGEFFGPFDLILRPHLEPHFYIRNKNNEIVRYEGQKIKQGGKKPLTFLAKVMLASQCSSSSSSNSQTTSTSNPNQPSSRNSSIGAAHTDAHNRPSDSVQPNDTNNASNASCVLSAKQLARFMGNRRNWQETDIQRYFNELCERKLGTIKCLKKFEQLGERKSVGFTHFDEDTLFYKTVEGDRQSLELHKLGLQLIRSESGKLEIAPKC
mmetsp:Transcript_27904/g.49248  ORF Transcript_27904/g.49248 Transcript_27904/m.49248 type:complete len:346 (+) Transcript_27904:268-1305(+)|eukprot:CAMPEP_0197529380 /NCGR_PEP_ID=MMETSP1318-20131121/28214_1 /TAXON_ID=552666 /ORGANISM="Partenskyella glossopodia, Strain RCC365" /LENGTH=345 /DNA_ID=CAMNT_0043084821 /DNA_START=193 /DNA_END=1230 /DNA_ORIENTATION=+